jgi:sugar-specific transcriptional regulator TrmB
MQKNVAAPLLKLGLKENEAQLYLTCLAAPAGLYVHEITKRSGLNRSTVDVLLDRLSERGMITSYKEDVRRRYVAVSPHQLLGDYEQRVEGLRGAIPMLLSLVQSGTPSNVTFFEGREGFRKLYHDIFQTLKTKSPRDKIIYSFSAGTDVLEQVPDMDNFFVQRRIASDIRIDIIAAQKAAKLESWVSNPAKLRRVKYFDDKRFPIHVEIDIYSNKVAFLASTEPYGGIILENRGLAEGMRSIFQLLWQKL